MGRKFRGKKKYFRPHLLSVFHVSLTISAICSGEKMTISSFNFYVNFMALHESKTG